MDIRNREASLGLEATTKEEGDTSIVPIRRVTKATARNLYDPNHPGDCECNRPFMGTAQMSARCSSTHRQG
jgi:hypothetical protein